MTESHFYSSHMTQRNNVCWTALAFVNCCTKVGERSSYEYADWWFQQGGIQNTIVLIIWSAGIVGVDGRDVMKIFLRFLRKERVMRSWLYRRTLERDWGIRWTFRKKVHLLWVENICGGDPGGRKRKKGPRDGNQYLRKCGKGWQIPRNVVWISRNKKAHLI